MFFRGPKNPSKCSKTLLYFIESSVDEHKLVSTSSLLPLHSVTVINRVKFCFHVFQIWSKFPSKPREFGGFNLFILIS